MPLRLAESSSPESRGRRALVGFELIDRFAQQQRGDGSLPMAQGVVEFQITHRHAGPNKIALPSPLEMEMVRNATGVYVFAGRVQPRGGLWQKLSPGRFTATVVSQFYQQAESTPFQIPALPTRERLQQLLLEPGAAYPFGPVGAAGRPTLVRGTLHRPDGRGIEAATLRVRLSVPATFDAAARQVDLAATSDESGHWVLPIADEHFAGGSLDASFLVRYPAPAAEIRIVDRQLQRGQDIVLLETRLQGSLQRASGEPVGSGQVRVAGIAGAARVQSNGEWTLYLPFGFNLAAPVQITAESPGLGSLAKSQLLQPFAVNVVSPFVF